ncbi:putative chaperone DNAJ protein [Trypanosoma cruzi]|uniref:Chaperone DnaJ protein, putative n=2 Tax=Trypanosoma cruzi TaxID=5693 RepID=Q4DHS2_TRYCC|nr:chaperone DnaJ protein, putative [Trypanosoma cruzi]EAN92074.1 chaperone DnaJ protein, putative [Trypanosoma cruzi]PWU98827.1 putative chaperone DNAJ protein [Trypanosoma cruzi]|eukprot:XP_813925.1 chaperone DnaJ protein [Trypanosoma cruzi strain CL Brener]
MMIAFVGSFCVRGSFPCGDGLCQMNGEDVRNYPARVLLAHDDRLVQFLDASVCQDWNAAVEEWQMKKQEEIAFQKKARIPTCVDVPSTSKTGLFSDEEFFFLTKQLENITAALSAHSATKAGVHYGENDFVYSPNEVPDLFLLDPAMHLLPLDGEKRRKCQEASEAYQRGSYGKAAEIFSSVIDSCLPNMLNAALISNRAACYLRVENYKLSLRDAIRSYEMDNDYILGVCRALRSLICCGRVAEARQTIERFRRNKCGYNFEREMTDISLYEKYGAFLEGNEHSTALMHLNELLERVPCATFEVLKVQLLAIEEGNEVALAHVNNTLRIYTDFPELLYWRAQLCFLESASMAELQAVLPFCSVTGSTDSTGRLRQVLQRVQYCVDLCREMEFLVSKSEWMRLIELCSKSVKTLFIGDRLRAGILAKRARGFYEIKHYYECMDDIDAAIRNITSGNVRAELLLLKALSEEKLLRWSDAIRSAELAMREHRTIETVEAWKRLCDRKKEYEWRKQQKQRFHSGYQDGEEGEEGNDSKDGSAPERNGFPRTHASGSGENERRKQHTRGPDHHVVTQLYAQLSLPTGASAERVKRSYRALAMRWHPDKWCSASDQQRKEAEEKFKILKAAYEELMCIVGG